MIDELRTEPIPFEAARGFSIVASEASDAVRVSIPPDLPVCPECLAEIGDSADRRFHYPVHELHGLRAPLHDRDRDAVRPREYDDGGVPDVPALPARVRVGRTTAGFHAQPNACPACGPSLIATTANGHRLETDDVIDTAARTIRGPPIVAIKGIGGFHLACDATSEAAVALLRQRKRRDEKPFAVMVADLAAARRLAVIGRGRRAAAACRRSGRS